MQKTTIFIFHGTKATPQTNWFPYLKKELELFSGHGIEVIIPEFSTPDNQSLDSWREIFSEYKEKINEHTIFIGHSIGAAFMLSVLEEIETPIAHAFIVAGFAQDLGDAVDKEYQELNLSFVKKDFSWKKIRKNSQNFTIMHSDNDPYVPLPSASFVAKSLKSSIELVPGAGHFNTESQYDSFPLLAEKVTEQIFASFASFGHLDMRAGTIRFVEPVEGSDKLLRCLVDFGPEVATMEYHDEASDKKFPVRQIVSGIRKYYPEYTELVGKTVLYVINLEPRTIMGVESQGMLMALGQDDCVFLTPEKEVTDIGRMVH